MEPVLENPNTSSNEYLDSHYNLYRLQKNMSVRLDRWHHIDNPIIGALVRLSVYEPEQETINSNDSPEDSFNGFVPLPSIYESND